MICAILALTLFCPALSVAETPPWERLMEPTEPDTEAIKKAAEEAAKPRPAEPVPPPPAVSKKEQEKREKEQERQEREKKEADKQELKKKERDKKEADKKEQERLKRERKEQAKRDKERKAQEKKSGSASAPAPAPAPEVPAQMQPQPAPPRSREPAPPPPQPVAPVETKKQPEPAKPEAPAKPAEPVKAEAQPKPAEPAKVDKVDAAPKPSEPAKVDKVDAAPKQPEPAKVEAAPKPAEPAKVDKVEAAPKPAEPAKVDKIDAAPEPPEPAKADAAPKPAEPARVDVTPKPPEPAKVDAAPQPAEPVPGPFAAEPPAPDEPAVPWSAGQESPKGENKRSGDRRFAGGLRLALRASIGIGGLGGHEPVIFDKGMVHAKQGDPGAFTVDDPDPDSGGDSVYMRYEYNELKLGPSLSGGAGLALLIPVDDIFGVSVGLQYSFYMASGSIVHDKDEYGETSKDAVSWPITEASVELHSLEIPALCRINAEGVLNYPVYAEAGLQLGFNVYARRTEYYSSGDKAKSENDGGVLKIFKPNQNIIAGGLVIGAGLDLDRVSVGLRGYFGLRDYQEFEGGKPWSITLGVTSLF